MKILKNKFPSLLTLCMINVGKHPNSYLMIPYPISCLYQQYRESLYRNNPPLFVIRKKRDIRVLELLLYSYDLHDNEDFLLRDACFYRQKDIVSLLLSWGANPCPARKMLLGLPRNREYIEIHDLLIHD